jgi:hypothetical protein
VTRSMRKPFFIALAALLCFLSGLSYAQTPARTPGQTPAQAPAQSPAPTQAQSPAQPPQPSVLTTDDFNQFTWR